MYNAYHSYHIKNSISKIKRIHVCCVCTSWRGWVGVEKTADAFANHSPPYFWRRSLTRPIAHQLARLAGWQAPESASLCLPNAGVLGMHYHAWLLRLGFSYLMANTCLSEPSLQFLKYFRCS